jgi:hypothetical protein
MSPPEGDAPEIGVAMVLAREISAKRHFSQPIEKIGAPRHRKFEHFA